MGQNIFMLKLIKLPIFVVVFWTKRDENASNSLTLEGIKPPKDIK